MFLSFCCSVILIINSLLGIPFEQDRELVINAIKNKQMGTPNPDFRPSKRTINYLDVEIFGQYAPAMYAYFDKNKFYRVYFEFSVPPSEKKHFKALLADSILARFPEMDTKAPFYFVSKDGLHHLQITEDKTGVIMLNDWFGLLWRPNNQTPVRSLSEAWEQYKKSRQ